MRRKQQRNSSSRAALAAVAGAVVVAASFLTSDGWAAAGKGRIIGSSWGRTYDCNFFTPNSEYGSTAAGQTAPFPGSPIDALLTALNMKAPTDPSQFILLQPPGTIANGTATQPVRAELLLGPGSEPFVIDSFFDITYQVADHGEHMLGPYVAEMLSMTLTGHHPVYGDVVLRESPTLASVGELNIVKTDADMKPLFQQSFFDVFVELSIGGGPFVPASNPFRIGYIPEPGTAGLMAIAIACFGIIRRRKS